MRYLNLSILLAVAVAMSLVSTPSDAASNEVPSLVQQGLKAFEAKQYEEATKSFEAALKAEPKDSRILFNLGCVKSAQGQYDEAVKLLEDASLTDDTELAVKCRYNLGQIAVDRAKAALGEKPDEAKQEARVQALEFINRATTDYSTCLEMNPDYLDARHNLELLRIWQRNMEQVWKEKDRQARRESMDLPKFVDWLDKEQRTLRTKGSDLEKQRKSPQRRLVLQDTSKEQRELSEEISPLKQKISDMINAQAGTPQGPGAAGQPMPGVQPGMMQKTPQTQQPTISPEQREQMVKALGNMAETAGESMTTASQYLNERMLDDASTSQGKSIEQIDQIGAIISPYPKLVQKAVAEQRQLTTANQKKEVAIETAAMDSGLNKAQRTNADGRPEPMREMVEAIEQQGNLGSATSAVNATPIAPNVSPIDVAEQPAVQPAVPTPDLFDPAEAAWQQRFVERWSHLLIDKAEQGLKNLPPEEPKAEEPKNEEPATPEEPKQLSPEEQAAQKEKAKIEGLRESMRRAVELGPEVVRLTREAARSLDDNKVDRATPRQEEALKLLEKIAEPLKDQDQQDQKDKKDPEKGDKDKPNQPSKPQPSDKDKGKDKPKPKAEPRDLSKLQAEALIRKVKDRQRKADERRALSQEKAYGPRKVEKDW